ncbi:MAG: carbohydrate-binding protein [Tannerella sp.]|jgi:hypothetical protein|nr:carbohydrate-binding protein [Tannerella sp.]
MKNIIFSLIGLLIITNCERGKITEVSKQIFVDYQSLNMFVNEEVKITASPTTENFKWESENTAVATVSAKGEVKATGEGSTNIVVGYGNVLRSIPVSVVVKIPATGLTLSKTSLEMKPRENVSIVASLLPDNSNEKANLTWRSANTGVAKVTGGFVEAVGVGVTEIFVKLEGSAIPEQTVPVAVDYTFPYNGPHILSADAPYLLQARDFDTGGEGYAYHDNASNQYAPAYRPELTGQQPGIEGGTHIGYIAAGEWLQFTVDVVDAGIYEVDLEMTAASANGITYLEVDGVNQSGDVTVPNNGSWSAFGWISTRGATLPQLNMTAGRHKVKWVFSNPTYNLRALKFTKL